MQAIIKIYCEADKSFLGEVKVDTADMPNALQQKINHIILAHRKNCRYYGQVKSR